MSPADMPEPPPQPGTGDVWHEILLDIKPYLHWPGVRPLWHDMADRRRFGIEKHGTPLQRDNERKHWIDAFQEALDLVVYLRAADAPWWLRWGAVAFAWAIRGRLPAM